MTEEKGRELTVTEPKALTANEIKANVNLIQKVMESVMKKDVHYGKVPGCGDKVVLLKAGAEKILSTFRIAAQPVVEDLSKDDEVRYRVTCNGVSMGTGMFLGAGVGECSSNEDKYKWKKPSCEKEYETTAEDRKRIKYKDNYGNPIEIKQIRTNPADVANTVLKMAKKRAQVDMTLTVTAASDCFEQDLDEITDEMDIEGKAPINREMPKAKTDAPAEHTGKEEPIKSTILSVVEAHAVESHEAVFDMTGIFQSAKEQRTKTKKTVYACELTDIETGVIFGISTWKKPEMKTGTVVIARGVKVYNPSGEDARYSCNELTGALA